ncbi:hypothetical protein N7519_007327 [Penicillium mononematosum]|uniref:uncharacterized protein n=1 Tax=Penicillium mononematosum TaxID=268346 RepID=UPI002547FD26|nr:uncharacterized protein N7519_007327 [Penicillium mononematosum]KAJ6186026.1 hypothetical protein N7519_007327 [Penicillium mononematosum]
MSAPEPPKSVVDFLWFGPRPARPPPERSDIIVVADIPPVPPIRPPDAIHPPDTVHPPDAEPQASASTSGHLRQRLQRLQRTNALRPITLGHSVSCGCEYCRNRRFNRMTPMEEGQT